MKNIALLVDFTDTVYVAEKFAASLGAKSGATVRLIHVCADEDHDTVIERMKEYAKYLEMNGVEHTFHVAEGSFMAEINNALSLLNIDLMVVGTHGKRGLIQNLFGAHIMKLINHVDCPTLVVNDNSTIDSVGIESIICPVGSHHQYFKKVKNTAALAKIYGARVSTYQINKPGVDLSENGVKNLAEAKEYFSSELINYQHVEEEAEGYSLTYAKQMLESVSHMPNTIISIMKDVSDEGYAFGKLDKEIAVLNEEGIPILAT